MNANFWNLFSCSTVSILTATAATTAAAATAATTTAAAATTTTAATAAAATTAAKRASGITHKKIQLKQGSDFVKGAGKCEEKRDFSFVK